MQRGNGTEHADWNTQRERLAAYLDDELASVEREQLERHLADCTDCQRALAEQREVRMLLRALPIPRVPRSFALPDGEADALPARLRARRATPPAPLVRVLQWSGSIAAAVGLLLVLGSTVLGLGQPHQATSTAYAPNAPSTNSSQRAPINGEPSQTPIASGGVNQPTVTLTPQASPHQPANNQPTYATQPSQSTQPTKAAQETGGTEPPRNLVPAVGTGLTVGGLCLLIISWLARRVPGQRRR